MDGIIALPAGENEGSTCAEIIETKPDEPKSTLLLVVSETTHVQVMKRRFQVYTPLAVENAPCVSTGISCGHVCTGIHQLRKDSKALESNAKNVTSL